MTPATTPAPAPAPAPPGGPAALTLDDFLDRYAGAYVEVIDGVVQEVPMPQPLHGAICLNTAIYVGGFIKQNGLGVVCSNDTFVVIRRDPLRVRGADVVYWSKAKAPDGVPATGMITAAPDLCVEVVSPTNTWTEVFTKVGEYLGIGVPAVLVLDPDTLTASVYRDRPGTPQQVFNHGDTLTLPDVLPGFAVQVKKFFE
ncbi:Uncharacterized protein OS=Planctomyces limnophilus (strain ATCC 43296 / DSM 3776 / IFAM 1008 / 290) GN=Plim_0734 PE=4 SV=1: Uma2 [Gemmataceae bacterium]|nr:Uncharacterized protein OS=Planctomyces limnophilus (strain ATCC 43296 / DSM 3776 / IFAM 1008 / 290) GN=Plim_0734 PE=4 SV=1: Uma2 [Gemmataceae bacterium]VTU01568.1 Uncharacterized protein OS=Planctomyces limnophilus (strain ATCC 43296 / DSM 3776 / IFAM 1008 / 290) GN=Plim_0734 PE=4 SV=1: Uma2 [Gemmataceae bacterium]